MSKVKVCPDCHGSGISHHTEECDSCDGFGEIQEIPKYTTDGMIVQDDQGGCMGIFSTVSLLNDTHSQNEKMKKCLEAIANEDFRGNRSDGSVKAHLCLKEMGLRK